jgi:hypothetical protein
MREKIALISLFLLAAPLASFASFISIDTHIAVSVRDNTIIIDCKLTNNGDESAHEVEMEADFEGEKFVTHPPQTLPKGQSIHKNFHLFPKTMFSRMVIPLTIRYKDANRYPFSALAFAEVKAATDSAPAIFSKVEDAGVSKTGNLAVKIKSIDRNAHNAVLRIITPHELTVNPLSKTIRVPSSGFVEETFDLQNFSALAPSTYTVLAIISEKRDSGQYDTISIGKVFVLPEAQWSDFLSHPYLVWALILLFIAYVIYLFFHARFRKR